MPKNVHFCPPLPSFTPKGSYLSSQNSAVTLPTLPVKQRAWKALATTKKQGEVPLSPNQVICTHHKHKAKVPTLPSPCHPPLLSPCHTHKKPLVIPLTPGTKVISQSTENREVEEGNSLVPAACFPPEESPSLPSCFPAGAGGLLTRCLPPRSVSQRKGVDCRTDAGHKCPASLERVEEKVSQALVQSEDVWALVQGLETCTPWPALTPKGATSLLKAK